MKKGQAAFEYLTTYGWAMLAIVVTIGTLAYFGIFNPSQFVPERCYFGAQLICEDYMIQRQDSSSSIMRWKVRNDFSKAIRITQIEGVDQRYPLTGCNTPIEIAVGSIKELECSITDANLLQETSTACPPASLL